MKTPRRLRLILVTLVVVALLLVAMWPAARLVDTAPVELGEVRDSIEAEGRTRLKDRFEITAPLGATARRLQLEPGDLVARGDILVTLEAVRAPSLDARGRRQAEAAVEAARARLGAAGEQVRLAEARAAQAIAEDQRQEALLDRRLVATEMAERARTARIAAEREVGSARFARATAQHELAAAQAVLARDDGNATGPVELEVTSPIDGVVLRRHFESSRAVQVGEPLLDVGDPAALEVEVDVLSSDAVRLQPGIQVELLRWGGEPVLPARVRRVEPGGFTKVSALGVEEQRVWVILDIDAPPATFQGLGDAYRVNARFILGEARDVLRAPASAVFRHGNGDAVLRVDGRRARLQPVRIGLRGGGDVEILDGLAQGDRVVVHPDRELSDGDRIRSR
jgi:HlyD family secretion protein